MARAALAGLLLLLGACEGPNQKAGREKDRADAVATGQNVTSDGPNERLGEAQDRVDSADRKAREAAAAALQSRSAQLRGQADIEADRLDEQARKLRDEKK